MHAFNCSRHAVQSTLANGLNERKSRGRHLAVDAESDANILAWIKRKAEKSAAVTRTDIRNYCREVCKFQVSRGWIDSFISRQADELTEKKSSPQEEARLQVPRVFLEETIWTMHETIKGRPSELVFNLGEVGISDWEDRKSKRSQYSSSNISERETHFDCDLHIRKSRVPHLVHCYIAGFRAATSGAGSDGNADREAFDLDTSRQPRRPRRTLRKLHPNRVPTSATSCTWDL
jgi:hypothetical protein